MRAAEPARAHVARRRPLAAGPVLDRPNEQEPTPTDPPMSQRNSGFRRKKLDDYPTPPWVTEALLPHLPARVRTIWEPAAGSGQMARVLKQAGYAVRASDISQGIDFL